MHPIILVKDDLTRVEYCHTKWVGWCSNKM